MKIRDPPPGPYTRTQAGYNCKYEAGRREMVQSYNDVRESRETFKAPTMAIALAEEVGAASYASMALEARQTTK